MDRIHSKTLRRRVPSARKTPKNERVTRTPTPLSRQPRRHLQPHVPGLRHRLELQQRRQRAHALHGEGQRGHGSRRLDRSPGGSVQAAAGSPAHGFRRGGTRSLVNTAESFLFVFLIDANLTFRISIVVVVIAMISIL